MELVMNTINWTAEQRRFMAVAFERTQKAAKRAFRGWPFSKQEDAEAEFMGKVWDQWRRLVEQDKNPEPLLYALIWCATKWVSYDRRIAGRSRMFDIFDYRAGLKRQRLSGQGQPSPSDRSDPANPWIDWGLSAGDNPADLAATLEITGITLSQFCDL
jgi:hypothetical protein